MLNLSHLNALDGRKMASKLKLWSPLAAARNVFLKIRSCHFVAITELYKVAIDHFSLYCMVWNEQIKMCFYGSQFSCNEFSVTQLKLFLTGP